MPTEAFILRRKQITNSLVYLQTACENTIRVSNGVKRIQKTCKQLESCLNNNQNNLDSCDEDAADSTCWYCCQGDRCNGPEKAVVGRFEAIITGTMGVGISRAI